MDAERRTKEQMAVEERTRKRIKAKGEKQRALHENEEEVKHQDQELEERVLTMLKTQR